MNPFEEMLWGWLGFIVSAWFVLAFVGGWYWYRMKSNEPKIID